MPAFELVTVIGVAATLCSTTSFAPQAWKVIKTGDTKALSTPMYVVTVVGFVFWLTYGVMRADWPLIVTNAICFALSAFILMMKLLRPQSKRAVAKALDPGA